MLYSFTVTNYWSKRRILLCVNNCPTRCKYTRFVLSVNWSTCFGWFLHFHFLNDLSCIKLSRHVSIRLRVKRPRKHHSDLSAWVRSHAARYWTSTLKRSQTRKYAACALLFCLELNFFHIFQKITTNYKLINGCTLDDHLDIVIGVTWVQYFCNIDPQRLQSMIIEIL